MDNTFAPITIGSIGIGVNKMQAYLNLFQERDLITTKVVQDGDFGPLTANAVREFQAYSRLPINGMIDEATWNAIINKLRELRIVTNVPLASRSFYLAEGSEGLDVFKMQEYLNEIAEKNKCLRPLSIDGLFQEETKTTVSMFQYLYDLAIDGIIGKATWDSIINTRNNL